MSAPTQNDAELDQAADALQQQQPGDSTTREQAPQIDQASNGAADQSAAAVLPRDGHACMQQQQQQHGEGAQAPSSSADPTAAQKQQQKKKKKRKRNHDHPDLLAAVLGLKADDKSAMWEAYQRLRQQEFDLDAHFCLMVVTGLLGVFPQQRHVVSKTQHMCRLENTAAHGIV